MLAEAAGIWSRKRTIKKIIKNLEGTTKETAKTRQEIDVGIFQLPTLQSVIGKEMKDEKGQSVRVEKTPDNKYYLESL